MKVKYIRKKYQKIIEPFYKKYDSHLKIYVVTKVIVFYIADSFYKNTMCEVNFK